MEDKKKKLGWLNWFVIITFVILYALTSSISMIHIVDFFNLSNSLTMSWVISVAFEVGAAASLAALTILDRLKKELVLGIFVLLTLLQVMGNVYYSFTNLTMAEIKDWVDLFGLSLMDPIMQRRIISIVSGLPLPVIALGFIKSLTDYLKPSGHHTVFDEKPEEPKEKEEPKSEDPTPPTPPTIPAELVPDPLKAQSKEMPVKGDDLIAKLEDAKEVIINVSDPVAVGPGDLVINPGDSVLLKSDTFTQMAEQPLPANEEAVLEVEEEEHQPEPEIEEEIHEDAPVKDEPKETEILVKGTAVQGGNFSKEEILKMLSKDDLMAILNDEEEEAEMITEPAEIEEDLKEEQLIRDTQDDPLVVTNSQQMIETVRAEMENEEQEEEDVPEIPFDPTMEVKFDKEIAEAEAKLKEKEEEDGIGYEDEDYVEDESPRIAKSPEQLPISEIESDVFEDLTPEEIQTKTVSLSELNKDRNFKEFEQEKKKRFENTDQVKRSVKNTDNTPRLNN